MDEVDGMSAGDRGGVADLIVTIAKSKIPIIAICNDKYNQKLKSLRNHCLELEYRYALLLECLVFQIACGHLSILNREQRLQRPLPVVIVLTATLVSLHLCNNAAHASECHEPVLELRTIVGSSHIYHRNMQAADGAADRGAHDVCRQGGGPCHQ